MRSEREGDGNGLRYRVGVIAAERTLHDITRALALHDSVHLVLAASMLDDCRRKLEARGPNVLILIVPVERLGRIVREVREIVPAAALVVHATSGDDARDLVVALRCGVTGFVGARATIATLVDVIGSVARGEVRYATEAAGSVIRRLTSHADVAPTTRASPLLTAREREIASLMSSHSNRAIAETLGIELSTVKNHVHNILAKLLVRHRRDAVAALGPGQPAVGEPGAGGI